MNNDNKLNKKLIIEKPLPNEKKKSSALPILILIFLLCAAIAFVILEKLKFIDYLNFI